MSMFDKLIGNLKATRRTIVFTEGHDARILEATDKLLKEDLMNVILLGNVDEVKAKAAAGNFSIDGAEIIDPATYPEMDAMIAKMVELRRRHRRAPVLWRLRHPDRSRRGRSGGDRNRVRQDC